MYLFPLVGKGPIWSAISAKKLANNCKDYWWTNVLYVNNFYPAKLEKEVIVVVLFIIQLGLLFQS